MTPEEAKDQIRGFLWEVQGRTEVPQHLVDHLLAMREALLVAMGGEEREWCATHDTTKDPTAPHGRCTEVDTYMAEVHPDISGDATDPHWELWAGEPCELVTVWVVPDE